MEIAGYEKHSLHMTSSELAAKGDGLLDCGMSVVSEIFEQTPRAALLHKERDGEIALHSSLIGSAADQDQGRVPLFRQITCLEDSTTIEVARQEQNDVGGLGRLRIDQIPAKKRGRSLPTDQP